MCDPQRNGTGLLLERCNYTKVVGGEVSDCERYGICVMGPDDVQQRCTGVKIIGVTGEGVGAWVCGGWGFGGGGRGCSMRQVPAAGGP